MAASGLVRTVAEIGLGLLYLVGAAFNSLYTLRHGDEFYGSFARGSIFPPVRRLIERFVIPNSRPLTYVLVGFQLLVSFTILSRGPYVAYGLWAGALFSLGAAVVSNVPGAAANLALAAIQSFLAYAR